MPCSDETSGKILAIFPPHDQIATVFALRLQTNIDFDTAFLPWVNIQVILILQNKLKWVHWQAVQLKLHPSIYLHPTKFRIYYTCQFQLFPGRDNCLCSTLDAHLS